MTPNRPPVELTIHEIIRQLTLVMEKASPEERESFRRAWLDSIPRFEVETERMRQERIKRQGYALSLGDRRFLRSVGVDTEQLSS